MWQKAARSFILKPSFDALNALLDALDALFLWDVIPLVFKVVPKL